MLAIVAALARQRVLDISGAGPVSGCSQVIEADVVQEMETPQVVDGESAPEPADEAPKKGKGRARKTAGEKAPRAAKQSKAPKARAAAKPRSRSKKTADASAE